VGNSFEPLTFRLHQLMNENAPTKNFGGEKKTKEEKRQQKETS
jgi:hypothetical protein